MGVSVREKWKDVPDYEGYYQVSSCGRVRSLPRKTSNGRRVKGKYLSILYGNHGYSCVSLSKNGVIRQVLVHRLVLTTFVGPHADGMECCHKDGDKNNNEVSNLRWGTRTSNEADKVKHETSNRGERHGMSKLCELDVWLIRNCASRSADLAAFFEVCTATIHEIRRRKTWKHI